MALSFSQNDIAIASIDSRPISVSYLLDSLKTWRQLSVIDDVIERFVIEMLFEQNQITVEEDDILEYQSAFREENDLFDEKSTRDWLRLYDLADEDFWRFCEFNAKLRKLKENLVGDRVDQRFTLDKLDLETVELYHIILQSESAAREIKSLVDEGEDFCVLARTFSTEESTRKQCGYMGMVRRKDLRAEIEAAVFQSKPGEVVGPFSGVRGYHLYMVSEFHRPVLDLEMRAILLDALFSEYLKQYTDSLSLKKFSDLAEDANE